MTIFNVFYGDGYESSEYVGSSLTLDKAIELMQGYWRYQPYEDGDEDNPKWVKCKNFLYPVKIKIKNPEYDDYFTIEEYEIKE